MSARRASIDGDLVEVDGMTDDDVEHAFAVMAALGRWQDAARTLAEASARYMHLNETDMRAIRMIMRAEQRGEIVTPKDISHDVGISSASTTKLIDRLVARGHLVRAPHPTDRRTMRIRVTPSTRRSAHDTVGRQHARRFAVAAALSADERDAVIRFLDDMTRADAPQGVLLDPHGARPSQKRAASSA
ncbi:MAG TPA: MarR family transcriptional regulator [Microbacterium sp.]|nr:MarR family transcriptional regulator [Microbacterium sp.]